MPKATSKRRYTMIHLGISRTIEEYSAPEYKRREAAKDVIFGDGESKVTHNHDPARGMEPITIKLITTDDDPYIGKAELAFDRHQADPATAESVVIRCHKDNGVILSTRTFVKAVIQGIKYPEGSTASHDNGMFEITVLPDSVLRL